MKETPIIFQTDMVKAIQEDRKSMTRRIVKPQPDHVYLSYSGRYHFDGIMAKHPYQVGDRLWVRETHCEGCPETSGVCYKADIEKQPSADFCPAIKWKPSIHMIWLEITEVRVERLQEITNKDAEAEGVESYSTDNWQTEEFRGNFAELWDSINAKRGYGWDTNPFVWCISFKKVLK